jgi:hypothetical protein
MTVHAGGRGVQLVGRTAAVDHDAALGGTYRVRGTREGAVGLEVPAAATRQTTLLAEPHRLE